MKYKLKHANKFHCCNYFILKVALIICIARMTYRDYIYKKERSHHMENVDDYIIRLWGE